MEVHGQFSVLFARGLGLFWWGLVTYEFLNTIGGHHICGYTIMLWARRTAKVVHFVVRCCDKGVMTLVLIEAYKVCGWCWPLLA